MGDYRTTKPEEIWKKIRDGEITEPTAGMCGGYAQANLVILPKKYAEDFKKFAERNPKPCPILEIMDGSPLVHDMGEGANIVTDIPRYFIYKNGVKVDEVTDASEYWQDDLVFLSAAAFPSRRRSYRQESTCAISQWEEMCRCTRRTSSVRKPVCLKVRWYAACAR